MASFRLRGKGECDKCPLQFNHEPVFGLGGEQPPKIALVGEAPGETEDLKGEPFVGSAGRFLQVACSKAGLLWQNLYKTNVILCRPPQNNIQSVEAEDAIERCRKRFIKEVEELKKTVKVFVALGGTATKAFGINESITKVRGSVFVIRYDNVTKAFVPVEEQTKDSFIVIPTFHPSFIMRGQFAEEVTWRNDLEKARQLSTKTYVAPVERFRLKPSLTDVKDFVKRALDTDALVGVDIETTSLEPKVGSIIMVGLALNGEEATVVPILDKGGLEYWKPVEKPKVYKELTRLFEKGRTMFQNALFDVRHLELNFDCTVRNIEHDSLLLHHAIHPELPHNLGYIVSVYGRTPYWKGVILGRESRLVDCDQLELRRYNARDSVVLHQTLYPMLEDVKEVGTEDVYKNVSMKLIRPILEMIKNGVTVDSKKLKSFKEGLTNQLRELRRTFEERFNTPEHFNFESGDDLRYLLFGVVPAKLDRAVKELETCLERGDRLNKNTKKFKNLNETVDMFAKITPILDSSDVKKRTESGKVSLDEDSLLMLKRSLLKQGELEEAKKNKSPALKVKLDKAVEFVNCLLKYKELSKMKSTYTEFPVKKDGKVHGEYMIHGTATGRLSSRNPNMQNWPKAAKKICVPEQGNVFIQADFSNLELRILGFVSNDEVLQAMFDKGLNVHSENCKLMFGIDESHPDWDAARRACKIYIFGRNYGGGLKGIFERTSKEVPDLNLSFSRFQKIDREYRRAHPKYVKWEQNIRMEVRATRKLTTVLGRTRYFLGAPYDIEKEGLNFPIQSVAADVMNGGLIELYKIKPSYLKMCATVHDSVLVEVPKGKEEEATSVLKKALERPYVIFKKKRTFPIDVKVGETWGDV